MLLSGWDRKRPAQKVTATKVAETKAAENKSDGTESMVPKSRGRKN